MGLLAGHNGQDSDILPARVANHKVGFGSSCSLTSLAIYITKRTVKKLSIARKVTKGPPLSSPRDKKPYFL